MKIERRNYIRTGRIEFDNNVAMYGAGTQSTGMILNALTSDGERPDFAVFSDTGAEPDHVIDYKDYFSDYVKNKFGFNIYTVSKGNLEKDIIDYIDGKSKRVSQIPLRSDTGLLMRQCTQDYKILPADRFIKKQYPKGQIIALWMGISVDEFQRMKTSTQKWKVLLYPLIEQGFRRNDTIRLVKKHGLKEPPRSACYFCPFHSNDYWKYLKNKHPDEYKKAINFDEKIRNYPNLKNKMYLHKKTIPLSKVDYNQRDLFDLIDDCEGICGI